ncbi:hypothetical protein [Stakelama tenebrarum]|uniref:hypothetical protein n=1 Tax=Stakelama tenebrarum TaxID=2711215 RepID=UPI0019D16F60|nr:hypothetical protein [Sphingosinithalassobacter tenebrarum]
MKPRPDGEAGGSLPERGAGLLLQLFEQQHVHSAEGADGNRERHQYIHGSTNPANNGRHSILSHMPDFLWSIAINCRTIATNATGEMCCGAAEIAEFQAFHVAKAKRTLVTA